MSTEMHKVPPIGGWGQGVQKLKVSTSVKASALTGFFRVKQSIPIVISLLSFMATTFPYREKLTFRSERAPAGTPVDT